MSNAIILPLTATQEMVIASDNSGAIGEKEHDEVHVPNTVVAHYACRVAMMECMAVRGEPSAVVMQNFTDEIAWDAYQHGVRQVMEEIDYGNLPITGSTESNFPGLQSGLGLTIIGKRPVEAAPVALSGDVKFAVIGVPLVGNEVVEQADKIAPLRLFKKLCDMAFVRGVAPVGSKGIAATWQKWTNRTAGHLSCSEDILKSAGPATCFIIAFEAEDAELIESVAGIHYHELIVG
ncbi:hypothetical protein [Virgibacillus sp. SK37]|uniref:hypothetical protein n=1 Tax=Virgibacillus sp. SK37 TaxID=403957 RepID=UPI0004D0D482|nr:hypothetical protein [Virgibacillus sp. SK37]AIF42864.1 ATPase [Virgibacillus sp. SK37]